MKKGYVSSEFVIKSEKLKKTVIKGYASVFGVSDSHNDIVIKGAFKSVQAKNVRLLWQHDITKPIGVIRYLEEDQYGLKLEAEINNEIIAGCEAASLIKQGAICGLSIGFLINSSDYNKKGERVIDDADLMEISIVTFPANKRAEICEVKNAIIDQENSSYEESMGEDSNIFNPMPASAYKESLNELAGLIKQLEDY